MKITSTEAASADLAQIRCRSTHQFDELTLPIDRAVPSRENSFERAVNLFDGVERRCGLDPIGDRARLGLAYIMPLLRTGDSHVAPAAPLKHRSH